MIIGLIGGGLVGLPAGMRYPTLNQGKDTVADYLATKGFTRVAFADNLKMETASAFGTTVDRLNIRELKEVDQPYLALVNCSNDEFVACALRFIAAQSEHPLSLTAELAAPRSPRFITQLWGTQYRRMMYGDNYWAEQGCAEACAAPSAVVTDVRMPNEPVVLKQAQAFTARIIRIGTEVVYTGEEHASEIALLTYLADFTLINRDGDFEGLYRQLDAMLAQFSKISSAKLLQPA